MLFAFTLLLAACGNQDAGKPAAAGASGDNATTATQDAPKSLPAQASRVVGNASIRIHYTAPAVRGRAIWGALVPYDQVWVTGAHNATTLEIDRNFSLGGKAVPAGKYALFTIPGRETWTVIINKNWDQHLADEYAESEDLARIQVKPQALAEVAERLKYEIEPAGDSAAQIGIAWEKVRVSFPIQVQ